VIGDFYKAVEFVADCSRQTPDWTTGGAPGWRPQKLTEQHLGSAEPRLKPRRIHCRPPWINGICANVYLADAPKEFCAGIGYS